MVVMGHGGDGGDGDGGDGGGDANQQVITILVIMHL